MIKKIIEGNYSSQQPFSTFQYLRPNFDKNNNIYNNNVF